MSNHLWASKFNLEEKIRLPVKTNFVSLFSLLGLSNLIPVLAKKNRGWEQWKSAQKFFGNSLIIVLGGFCFDNSSPPVTLVESFGVLLIAKLKFENLWNRIYIFFKFSKKNQTLSKRSSSLLTICLFTSGTSTCSENTRLSLFTGKMSLFSPLGTFDQHHKRTRLSYTLQQLRRLGDTD